MKMINQIIFGKGLFDYINGHLCIIKGHLGNPEGQVGEGEGQILLNRKLFLTHVLSF